MKDYSAFREKSQDIKLLVQEIINPDLNVADMIDKLTIEVSKKSKYKS